MECWVHLDDDSSQVMVNPINNPEVRGCVELLYDAGLRSDAQRIEGVLGRIANEFKRYEKLLSKKNYGKNGQGSILTEPNVKTMASTKERELLSDIEIGIFVRCLLVADMANSVKEAVCITTSKLRRTKRPAKKTGRPAGSTASDVINDFIEVLYRDGAIQRHFIDKERADWQAMFEPYRPNRIPKVPNAEPKLKDRINRLYREQKRRINHDAN